MTVTLQTPLLGPVDLAAGPLERAIWNHTPEWPAYTHGTVTLWCAEALRVAKLAGFRASVFVAQMLHETNWLRFGGQVAPFQYNFAGIGATNGAAAGASFDTITDGLCAVVAHRCAYMYGTPEKWPAVLRPFAGFDVRIPLVLAAGYGGTVKTIGDFTNGRWAFSPAAPVGSLDNGYAAAIVRTANALLTTAGTVTEEAPTMPVPRIAVAAGHHNSSGGDAFEVKQTGPLAHELLLAIRALGMVGTSLTPEDGLGMDPAALDTVAARVVSLVPLPEVFVEVHTEGGGGKGVFVIYPDAPGDLDTDVRDTLGPLIAKKVAAATGLTLGGGGDGVMSERETGVGGQGFRLGVFRVTVPVAATMTRLIVEYGAHDKEPDLTIAKGKDFAKKCAAATAEAIAEWLGWSAPGDVTGQNVPTTTPASGHTVGGDFLGVWNLTAHGNPLGPMVKYDDGKLRQLFENVVLESDGRGNVRVGGLGQAYAAKAGSGIPDWPTVHPLLP